MAIAGIKGPAQRQTTLYQLTGVSPRTQRRYRQYGFLRTRKNYCTIPVPLKRRNEFVNEHLHKGVILKDGQVIKRLPNSYAITPRWSLRPASARALRDTRGVCVSRKKPRSPTTARKPLTFAKSPRQYLRASLKLGSASSVPQDGVLNMAYISRKRTAWVTQWEAISPTESAFWYQTPLW